MNYQQKWQFEYEKNGERKVCYPQSKEQIEKNKETCRKNGYKVLSVKKLYVFNTYKNQHNFELIHNICFNAMHDMEMGDVEWNEQEYERLESLKDRAEKYFCAGLPVAWVTWETWQDMKELSEMAIIHRQNACIANGRPDLVTYC